MATEPLVNLAIQGDAAEDLGLQTEEECIEAWQHLGPYAESLEKDSKALSRLHGRPPVCFLFDNLMLCMPVSAYRPDAHMHV